MNGSIAAQTNLAKFSIQGAIFVSLFTVSAVVLVKILRPADADDTTKTIVYITGPLITGLLGYGIHGLLSVVDGRMSQLLDAVAVKEHVSGALEGLAVNPKTNVAMEDVAPAIIDRRKTDGTADVPSFERRKNGTIDPGPS